MRLPLLLLVILIGGLATVNYAPAKVAALSTPKISLVNAFLNGWNSTTGPSLCTPSATANCNPTLGMFRGVTSTVNIKGGDFTHDFAIYTAGFQPVDVSTTNPCSLTNTNGCLVKSPSVSTGGSTMRLFAPTLPLDDFTGPATYEYYCQFHPDSMHGKIIVNKNPDIQRRGTVDIVDAAALALAFDTVAGNPQFNIAADLNNDGRVDILDASMVALFFDQPM